MFEIFANKKTDSGPLKKLSEKEIQGILYGHLRKEAQKETALIELQPPKVAAPKVLPPKVEIKKPVIKDKPKFEKKPQSQSKKQAEVKTQINKASSKKKVKAKPKQEKPKLKEVKIPALETRRQPVLIEEKSEHVFELVKPVEIKPLVVKTEHKPLFPKINLPKFDSRSVLKRVKKSLPLITVIVVVFVVLRISLEALQAKPTKTMPNNISKASKALPKDIQKSGRPYTIQVAVYTKEEDAQRLINTLTDKNYEASYVKTASSKGLPRYRVYVGNFGTKEAAGSVLKKLVEEENFADGFIRSH